MRIVLSLLIISGLLFSCGGEKREESVSQELDSAALSVSSPDIEMINAVLQQIPSPLEISVMLRESGMQYQKKFLNSVDNVSGYNTSYKKALNMGVYGTDLGYTNIFSKNQDGIEYVSTIKSLADDLEIGQFFDVETIRRLATNSQNLDSLLLTTTRNFNDINNYLQLRDRSKLSALLLVGGWVEAMYITCEKARLASNSEELIDVVGDQKTVAELINQLLEMFKGEEDMDQLNESMKPLWNEFNNVTITVTPGEQKSEVVDGVLVISDGSQSDVQISDETFNNIAWTISKIRNDIILIE